MPPAFTAPGPPTMSWRTKVPFFCSNQATPYPCASNAVITSSWPSPLTSYANIWLPPLPALNACACMVHIPDVGPAAGGDHQPSRLMKSMVLPSNFSAPMPCFQRPPAPPAVTCQAQSEMGPRAHQPQLPIGTATLPGTAL